MARMVKRNFRLHLPIYWLSALLFAAAALSWQIYRSQQTIPDLPQPQTVDTLTPGIVARMDSAAFTYSPGWRVSATGADPAEPADPWNQPAGRIAFEYSGQALALQLAMGNYWGFVYVTVDGAAANRLPVIDNNVNARGEAAGYKPLLAPEAQTEQGPSPRWFVAHTAADDGPHRVEVEIWRSWGQTPVRAVAVDALPSPLPRWPTGALAVLAVVAGALGALPWLERIFGQVNAPVLRSNWPIPEKALAVLAVSALVLIAGGVLQQKWWLTDVGLALLALAGVQRPVWWVSALLFGLPFYLQPLPILPGRGLNLVEIGVWGGLAIVTVHALFSSRSPIATEKLQRRRIHLASPDLWLAAVGVLALIAALAATQQTVALREWRTVFLAGGGFALLLGALRTLGLSKHDVQTLLGWWLAGGFVVATIGLWQYVAGQGLIEAEGVNRVRALYGSPNNLALYLERTAAVALAVVFFGMPKRRIFWWILTLPQLATLLLTFSKGALLLGLPAMLTILAGGGFFVLRSRRQSLRPLWGLAGLTAAMLLGLLPFLGTERFRLLADFSAGTTGGLRLNLWRSSLRMALDHPWLGVGPDNFLYAYRSGYILPAAWQDPDLNHPHNVILDWWTRLGMGGLLLAGGWWVSGVRSLWRSLLDDELAALRLGCLAAVAAATAHGLIDASYALPDLMLVWVLLLGVGLIRTTEV